MNFATCPAMIERAKYPLYGYFLPRDEYYQSIINWQTRRNGFVWLERDCIGYENGVQGCVTSAIETLSAPGDKILLHSPTYVGFRADVEGLGQASVYSPLKRDENGVWRMDYEDMDQKLKKYHIHLAIFCSPTTPQAGSGSGGSWKRPWRYMRPTSAWSFPMKSGRTSPAPATSTSPPDGQSLGERAHHGRLRPLQDL